MKRLAMSWLVLGLGFSVSSGSVFAEIESESVIHNRAGIALVKQKKFTEALAEFTIAIQNAQPDSMEKLSAEQNIAVVYRELNRPEEAWGAEKAACEIDHKIHGVPLPDDYDGATPREAAEHKLLKAVDLAKGTKHNSDAQQKLIEFYRTTKQFEKGNQFYSAMVSGFAPVALEASNAEKQWGQFCKDTDHPSEAKVHNERAQQIEKTIAVKLKLEQEQAQAKAQVKTEEAERLRQKHRQMDAKHDAEQRALRAKVAPIHFEEMVKSPTPCPGSGQIAPDTFIGQKVELELKYLDHYQDDCQNLPQYRQEVKNSTGSAQLNWKAKCVDKQNRILEAGQNLLKLAKECNSSMTLGANPITGAPLVVRYNFYAFSSFFAEEAYKGLYLLVDPGDPVLDETYKVWVAARKDELEEIKQKASKFK